MASLSLQGLVKRYGQTQVVHGIDLDVADGEFIVLVGPSGCGKSTTLRMIAGLESVTEGTLRIGERVVGYFDTIGRIEGNIERLTPEGFVVELATTLRKRDKLAAQLIWLANRDQLSLPEDRRHDRIVPRDPRLMVRNLSNGLAPTIAGHVIDVSLSGARVSVPGEFQKGDDLMLGTTPARVVRVFDGGVAVEFRAPVPEKMFSPAIRL